jgi:hypothetical protein
MTFGLGRRSVVRAAAHSALLPAAAFVVHELRYVLAFGHGAGIELVRQGHGYLHSLVPWLVLLVALAIGGFLWAVGRAFAGHTTLRRYTLSLGALWLLVSASLIGIFVAQEFFEGLFATGHPAGLAGIFGYGGWWSIPAALAVGLVVAVVLHGARWVIREVGRLRAVARIARPRRPLARLLPSDALVPRQAPLAAGFSVRGPPL